MGERVAAIAGEWIGTPYVHQASLKGGGADCLGLIRGVWCELYGAEPETLSAYTPDWGEIGGEEILMNAAVRHLHPVAAADRWKAGQVLLFRMRQGAIAKHLGILSRSDRFIHAYQGHGVVESPLSRPWRERVVARFRFPAELRSS